MSKKVKTLIIFGIAAVLLLGAFFALPYLLPEQEQGDDYTDDVFVLYDETGNELETITVEYGGESMVIEKLAANKYGVADIADYVTSSDLNNAFASARRLACYNKIEAGSDPADYGLDKPQSVVTLDFVNGTQHVIYIGDQNSAGTGYYTMVDDSDEIFVVQNSSYEGRYLATRSDLIDTLIVESFDTENKEEYPVFSYFEIKRPDLEKEIYIRLLSAEEKKTEYTEQGALLTMTSPVNSLVLTDAVNTYMYSFFGLTGQKCVAYNYTEDRAAEFGFDEPTAVLSTKYDNSELVLTVGSFADEAKTMYYLMSSRKPGLVYTVLKSDLNWVTVSPDQMVSPVAVQPYIKDISHISLRIEKGKVYNFELTHEDGENGKTNTTVLCNGEKVNTDLFKRYLQLLLYTSGEAIYYGEDLPDSNEVLYISYEYNNGTDGDVVRILKNTARYGVMEVNGHQNFTARLAYIDKLQTELGNLLDGNEIDTEW